MSCYLEMIGEHPRCFQRVTHHHHPFPEHPMWFCCDDPATWWHMNNWWAVPALITFVLLVLMLWSL